MKDDFRKQLNEKILLFLNRYLKQGVVIKATDAFYGRGDIEKIIKEAYDHGYQNGFEMGGFEKELNRIL